MQSQMSKCPGLCLWAQSRSCGEQLHQNSICMLKPCESQRAVCLDSLIKDTRVCECEWERIPRVPSPSFQFI